jgi:hypothetical protein
MQMNAGMNRSALILLAVVASPAWAVGERIIIPSGVHPYGEQLKETLCVSMECVESRNGGLDATVSGKLLKNKKGDQVELQVLAPSGALKATVKAPVNDAGRMSSTDLVAATSAIIGAIEAPEAAAKAPSAAAPTKTAKVAKKKSQALRLAAKARLTHSRG